MLATNGSYEITFVASKTALLEGLEVDQYMWGILNAIQKYVVNLFFCLSLAF